MSAMVSLIALVLVKFVLQTVPAPQPPATVEGVVLDDGTGQPLAGVSVGLSTPDGRPASEPVVTTDTHGRFSISTRLIGSFRVIPTKNGLIAYPPRGKRSPGLPGVSVLLGENTGVKNLELMMGMPGAISGLILGPDGRPTVNASASLHQYTYDKHGRRFLWSIPGGRLARPTDRGEFRLYDLQPGDYYLGITYENRSGIYNENKHRYFPTLAPDEARAVPISVKAGEEVRVGTLKISLPENNVDLRLRITAPFVLDSASIDVGGNAFSVSSTSNFAETSRRIRPGHYDVQVTTRSSSPNYYYAATTIDILGSDIVQELALKPVPVVSGKVLVASSSGEPVPAPPGVLCRLDGRINLSCVSSRVLPGTYQLEFQGISQDTYVLSAKANGRDVLAEGLNIAADTALEIVLAQQGASVEGIARTTTGETLVNGLVVLVPEEPYRRGQLRYSSVITNPDGKYELYGIAPGSYKLFAWIELPGEAFRNAEFMKEFEDRGRPIDLKTNSHEMMDLVGF